MLAIVKVHYIYSACVVIETRDARICCDPWFTQRIYDGSWFQYPVVKDPVGKIGPVDYVYISHIHRDHYDPPFLHELLSANPGCEILIGTDNQAFLREKMKRDGFQPRSVETLTVGATELAIIPNNEDSEINIDSALVVKGDGKIVVNLNDCPYDAQQIKDILTFCGRSPDFACLPYAGAGPYPQAYRFSTIEERTAAISAKKERFLLLFKMYFDALTPRMAMPFAGIYYLGGRLRDLNSLRGVPDAVEVRERFGNRVVVLAEGEGSIDLETDEIRGERLAPYDQNEVEAALRAFDSEPYPYERDPSVTENELVGLLSRAHANAVSRITDHPDRTLCIKCPETRYLCVDSTRPGEVRLAERVDDIGAREEIHIDSRLLSGLLQRKYHWHGAEAGSHFGFFREPEAYDRRIYNLLNFLQA
jgi:UDP-MurNAc hydroxylase